MMHFRYLRERFSPARRSQLRRRIGKLPIVSAAALGAVTFASLPATQSSTDTGIVRSNRASVVDIAAVPGHNILSDAVTAASAPAEPASAPAKHAETNAKQAESKKAPSEVELYYQYGVQTTPWYCGPAATRMALSARGLYPSQDHLAGRLGTTVDGTDSSADIARVLNAMTRSSHYRVTSIPSKAVTKRQIEELRARVVEAVSNGYPVVMNIAGSGTDVDGTTRNFPGGHYITVVGYQDNGNRVKIGDSANPVSPSYWMTTSELAHWAGTRGYAA